MFFPLIAAGAVVAGLWPGAQSTIEREPREPQHWAFQPIQDPVVPAVVDADWCRAPVDRFILAKLEESGVPPASAADRATWLRRVSFDLTGLPPTAEEIDRFLATDTVDGCEQVVDRLLSSPAYGERWGRHWLDLARYGDSNGGDENHARPHHHHYRNWVIEAFNRDLPYDRFLHEQIAGDLLEFPEDPDRRAAQLTATGFLAIGMQILAEQDPVKRRMDFVDEQIDTLSRSVLGLTVACARCHDHKFDPISTRDYYALAGILHSTEVAEQTVETSRFLQDREAHEKQMGAAVTALRSWVESRDQRLLTAETRRESEILDAARELKDWRRFADPSVPLANRLSKQDFLRRATVFQAEDFARGNVVIDREQYGNGVGIISDPGGQENYVEYDLDLEIGGPYQVELRYAAENARPGRLLLNGVVLRADAISQATGGWFPKSQRWFVEGVFEFKAGENVLRLESSPLMSHIDQVALIPVDSSDNSRRENQALRSGQELAAALNLRRGLLEAWADLLGSEDAPGALQGMLEAARRLPETHRHVESEYEKADQEELARMRQELKVLTESAPVPGTVSAVKDGKVVDLPIHERGSHLALGDVVGRGVPAVLGECAVLPKAQSGRLELARWLTSPDHPLTARVMANRLWRWLFGAGLVLSPDNFGLRGELPTHPELLDHLARRLIERGWSIKAVLRELVLSSTYRMSTTGTEEAIAFDPTNRLHSRHLRQRLDAESIRDAILAITGRLDRSLGGAPLEVTTQNPSPTDKGNNREFYEASRRRSVYLPVVRTHVYEMLSLFDFPNPGMCEGDRVTTTVPTQALWLLNSPWLRERSQELAVAVCSDEPVAELRVESLYRRVLGRSPTAEDTEVALAFLVDYIRTLPVDQSESGREAASWASLCQVLFMSNEMVYLR